MISVHFQGKPFNITVIQVYAPTSNAEESEVEWFYEDLQDLLELTPKKDVLFIIPSHPGSGLGGGPSLRRCPVLLRGGRLLELTPKKCPFHQIPLLLRALHGSCLPW